MRIKIQGLSQQIERAPLVEGLYRARVVRFEPAGHAPNPCRVVSFLILAPDRFAGRHVRTRLYCHERALWKLRWFLSDFGYDSELFASEELDDRRVIGLEGVIRLAYGRVGSMLLKKGARSGLGTMIPLFWVFEVDSDGDGSADRGSEPGLTAAVSTGCAVEGIRAD